MRLLTESWITEYMKLHENTEPPTNYHLWTALSVISAALRRKVYWGTKGFFAVYPNLFVVLIGPSGVRKSTAANYGMKLLDEVDGMNIIRDKSTPEALLEALASAQPIQNPDDMTFRTYAHGMCYASELSTMLGSNVKYLQGLNEQLTALSDCLPKYEYRTKTSGHVKLEHLYVTLLGCSTPEWLATTFRASDLGGGFMGRFLFVVENEKAKSIPLTQVKLSSKEQEQKQLLINDLQHIANLEGSVTITPEAEADHIRWYHELEKREPPQYAEYLKGFLQRLEQYVMKVAMLYSVSMRDDLVIELEHLQWARSKLEDIEQKMGSAFAYIGAKPEAILGDQMYMSIKNTREEAIARKKLYSEFGNQIHNERHFNNVITNLVNMGKIAVVPAEDDIVYMTCERYDKLIKEKQKEISKNSQQQKERREKLKQVLKAKLEKIKQEKEGVQS